MKNGKYAGVPVIQVMVTQKFESGEPDFFFFVPEEVSPSI